MCADYAASDRGAGHLFGQRAYAGFLERHGFAAMVRAHEVCRRGCRRAFGTCWTVFSHPQYLGLANAAGALVIHADNSFEPQVRRLACPPCTPCASPCTMC